MGMLKQLMQQTKQARVIHTYRTVLRFGSSLKTTQEVRTFVEWMKKGALASSTQSMILSTIRSVQPKNKALASVVIKVPTIGFIGFADVLLPLGHVSLLSAS